MTTHYFEALSDRYGAGLREFVRYYVAPGYGHGSGAFHLQWDSLAALDRWVETGEAPIGPVVADGSADGRGRTRPLCEYPKWPKYVSGPDDAAASFVCAD